MNSLEEYRKYKKMYINFKKMNQTGGAFFVANQITPSTVFNVESKKNSGQPREDDSKHMSNQCMFISISDFLKARGQDVTVRELRIVGGLDARSERVEFDEGWLHSTTALENIAKHYNIRISVYTSLSSDITKLEAYTGNLENSLCPKITYTKDGQVSGFDDELLNEHTAQHTVHIVHRPGHYELITKITSTDGEEIYDLKKTLDGKKFGTPPGAKAPSDSNEYTPPLAPVVHSILNLRSSINKNLEQLIQSKKASIDNLKLIKAQIYKNKTDANKQLYEDIDNSLTEFINVLEKINTFKDGENSQELKVQIESEFNNITIDFIKRIKLLLEKDK